MESQSQNHTPVNLLNSRTEAGQSRLSEGGMVERIAQSMFNFLRFRLGASEKTVSWENADKETREFFLRQSRAILTSMLKPTDSILRAIEATILHKNDRQDMLEEIWRAAVSASLNG